MKWIIDKVVGEFDYGHNVWTQELDEELSCGSQCKCKWRHGHRGKVVAYLEANELSGSSKNMVVDFNDMKIMTKFIDSTLDHKYLIDINDPANFDTFSHFWVDGSFKQVLVKMPEGHYLIDPIFWKDLDPILQTKYESYVILDFVPTSENLSKWMFEVMSMKIDSTGVKVHKIEWYETPKSRATYYGD
jgi:6-pyruvoyltetrahydropterin/6-carboxytetrahydropterin synthase